MNRVLAGLLAIVVLVVGVAIGIVAGSAAGSPASSPVAVVTSAPATPTPTPELSPGVTPAPTPTPSATPLPTPTPEPTPVLVAAPLTGRLVTEAQASRHVIAVMIDDLYAARPQSGLSEASVVWHAPAEGGIPRYMALFAEGNPPQVGPIRSARMYYIAWAAEWNAVFVHAGGSPQAIDYLSTTKGRGAVVYNADALRGSGHNFTWRVKWRLAPHNVYSNYKRLRAWVRKVGAGPNESGPAWKFAPDADLSLRPEGGRIIVPYPYNKVTYRYHRASNTYLRSVSSEGKQVDRATKVRIAPKNVIVMFMRFGPLNDGSHKGRLEADYIGSGRAYIATNGRTIVGTWVKKSMKGPTRFYDKAGNPVTLTIGQTFVQVVQRGTDVTYQNGKVPEPTPSPTPSPTVTP
jgi:hypothetical protein